MIVDVRKHIEDIRQEVLETDLQPGRAAELMAKLTSLYSNVLDELAADIFVFNKVEAGFVVTEPTAARAKALARATVQYSALLSSQHLEKSTLQMMQSLKALVKFKQEEMRLGG